MKNIKTAVFAITLSSIATVASANDTSGFYSGLSFGDLNATELGNPVASGAPKSIFIGYNLSMYDNFTVSGELELGQTTYKFEPDFFGSISAPLDIKSQTVKARFGYDVSNAATVFAVVGKTKISTDGNGEYIWFGR